MTATAVAQQIVADITTKDVRATIDPQNIQPPCIVVVPDGFKFTLSGDCATYKFNIYAVAPGVRIADSLPALDALVDAIKDIVSVNEVNAGSVAYGDGELPAYVMPIEIDSEW